MKRTTWRFLGPSLFEKGCPLCGSVVLREEHPDWDKEIAPSMGAYSCTGCEFVYYYPQRADI